MLDGAERGRPMIAGRNGLTQRVTAGRNTVSGISHTLWSRHISYLALMLILLMPAASWAHGIAGKRFFPTIFSIEDPFVSDEFSLLFSHIRKPGEEEHPAVRETGVSLEYSKRITPRLGVSAGESYRHLDFVEAGSDSGFENLELGAKYQFLTSERHEAVLSFGVEVELGGTGTRRTGAESFSVITPALFFGKGFGDLPEPVKFLRPMAISGVIGPAIPTRSKNIALNKETGEAEIEQNPVTLNWGFALQYSLPYLQSFVRDVGLGAPFNRMVVLTEFPLETCVNRGCGGQTTGTINPGIVWIGRNMQLGVAAQIPINSRSGKNVGVFGLIHFFLDDLFPKGIGRPVFP